MTFAAGLEQAIATHRRDGLWRANAVSAITLVLPVLGWRAYGMNFFRAGVFLAEMLVVALAANGAVWFLALNGSPALRGLRQLRGGQPEHWLPSPTHGVVVATSEALLAGKLPRAELNRFDRRRVNSISYQEAEHALIIDVTNTSAQRGGSGASNLKRWVVKLDSSVTPEHAYAFARHVLALSQR